MAKTMVVYGIYQKLLIKIIKLH